MEEIRSYPANGCVLGGEHPPMEMRYEKSKRFSEKPTNANAALVGHKATFAITYHDA